MSQACWIRPRNVLKNAFWPKVRAAVIPRLVRIEMEMEWRCHHSDSCLLILVVTLEMCVRLRFTCLWSDGRTAHIVRSLYAHHSSSNGKWQIRTHLHGSDEYWLINSEEVVQTCASFDFRHAVRFIGYPVLEMRCQWLLYLFAQSKF